MYDFSHVNPSIRKDIENNATLRRLFSQKPESLLSIGSDAKTVKGEKKNYLTGILYLAPYNTSGLNVCPMATIADCISPCLFTAGRGAMYSVFFSRLRKTLFLQQYKQEFLNVMANDIEKLIKKGKRNNMNIAIRPNGTSDLRFENYGIIQAFDNVQWYDYTKIANRKNIPHNYDLTFSYSGASNYAPYVKQALENNMRLATVFRNRETVEYMLSNGVKFMGRDIVDGDETDLRFLEPVNCITALYAKGRAKRDGTGFVVDMPEMIANAIAA